MANNLVGTSSEQQIVAEEEINEDKLANAPPGHYFIPSASEFIEHYLVNKILGVGFSTYMVKIRDSVQLLDPDQINFGEFKYCKPNEAYYITKKAERKTDGETTIKTTTGHWKESKSTSQVLRNGQIVGYKNTFTFSQADGKETDWKLNEYTVVPDIIPVDALTDKVRAEIEEYVACRIRLKKVKLIINNEEIEMDEDEDEDEDGDVEE